MQRWSSVDTVVLPGSKIEIDPPLIVLKVVPFHLISQAGGFTIAMLDKSIEILDGVNPSPARNPPLGLG